MFELHLTAYDLDVLKFWFPGIDDDDDIRRLYGRIEDADINPNPLIDDEELDPFN